LREKKASGPAHSFALQHTASLRPPFGVVIISCARARPKKAHFYTLVSKPLSQGKGGHSPENACGEDTFDAEAFLHQEDCPDESRETIFSTREKGARGRTAVIRNYKLDRKGGGHPSGPLHGLDAKSQLLDQSHCPLFEAPAPWKGRRRRRSRKKGPAVKLEPLQEARMTRSSADGEREGLITRVSGCRK